MSLDSAFNYQQPIAHRAGAAKLWANSTRPARMLGYDVLYITSECAGVSVEELRSARKTKQIMHARHVVYAMMSKHSPHLSDAQISRVLRKDHTCKINSRARVPILLETDKAFSDLFHFVDAQLAAFAKRGFRHKTVLDRTP